MRNITKAVFPVAGLGTRFLPVTKASPKEMLPVVNNEPFCVLLADDLIDAHVPVIKQMVDVAGRENASTIGVMEVPSADVASYGIIEAIPEPAVERLGRISRMVEKPKAGSVSST